MFINSLLCFCFTPYSPKLLYFVEYNFVISSAKRPLPHLKLRLSFPIHLICINLFLNKTQRNTRSVSFSGDNVSAAIFTGSCRPCLGTSCVMCGWPVAVIVFCPHIACRLCQLNRRAVKTWLLLSLLIGGAQKCVSLKRFWVFRC